MSAPLAENDAGWDFKVLVLDGEWVLRVPRSAAAAAELEKEIELLPALAPMLPVEIPRFEQASREPPFVVYRLIAGEPLENEDPDGVRGFLEALHSLDPAGLAAPTPDWVAMYRRYADGFRRTVLPLLDVDERARGETLLGEVETLIGYAPAVTHSDWARRTSSVANAGSLE